MSARNPYERRAQRGADMREAEERAWQSLTLESVGPRPLSPLLIEDLEAIAYRHHRRGFDEGRASREDDLAHARRDAWEQGYDAGLHDGKSALLSRIDEVAGERVRGFLAATKELLDQIEGAEPTPETTAGLLAQVQAALLLADWLVTQHHNAFEDLPF